MLVSLTSSLGQRTCRIGLNDAAEKHVWVWSSGEPLGCDDWDPTEKLGCPNWYPIGEPEINRDWMCLPAEETPHYVKMWAPSGRWMVWSHLEVGAGTGSGVSDEIVAGTDGCGYGVKPFVCSKPAAPAEATGER